MAKTNERVRAIMHHYGRKWWCDICWPGGRKFFSTGICPTRREVREIVADFAKTNNLDLIWE